MPCLDNLCLLTFMRQIFCKSGLSIALSKAPRRADESESHDKCQPYKHAHAPRDNKKAHAEEVRILKSEKANDERHNPRRQPPTRKLAPGPPPYAITSIASSYKERSNSEYDTRTREYEYDPPKRQIHAAGQRGEPVGESKIFFHKHDHLSSGRYKSQRALR